MQLPPQLPLVAPLRGSAFVRSVGNGSTHTSGRARSRCRALAPPLPLRPGQSLRASSRTRAWPALPIQPKAVSRPWSSCVGSQLGNICQRYAQYRNAIRHIPISFSPFLSMSFRCMTHSLEKGACTPRLALAFNARQVLKRLPRAAVPIRRRRRGALPDTRSGYKPRSRRSRCRWRG